MQNVSVVPGEELGYIFNGIEGCVERFRSFVSLYCRGQAWAMRIRVQWSVFAFLRNLRIRGNCDKVYAKDAGLFVQKGVALRSWLTKPADVIPTFLVVLGGKQIQRGLAPFMEDAFHLVLVKLPFMTV